MMIRNPLVTIILMIHRVIQKAVSMGTKFEFDGNEFFLELFLMFYPSVPLLTAIRPDDPL